MIVALDPLPISALQHLIFCERQCALIHIEGLWAENRLTVEGQILHKKAHGDQAGRRGGGVRSTRAGVRTVRGMPLVSHRLGLVGKADVIEFHPASSNEESGTDAAVAESLDIGRVQGEMILEPAPTPFPVEYKRGKPKAHDADDIQLCAQALCLEEMLGVDVPAGAIFYGRTRRRHDVPFTNELRGRTEAAAARLDELIASGVTPRVCREKKCDNCSMFDLCLPDATGPGRSATRYLTRALAATERDG